MTTQSTLQSAPRARHLALGGIALVALALSACAPRMERAGAVESAPYVPVTGAAQGVVVPAATPGLQTAPVGASTAGSAISETVTQPVRRGAAARRATITPAIR